MAPMTRSFSPGGVATKDVAAYYRRRAENEVGLIISEGTGVARPASLNDPNIPRFPWRRRIDRLEGRSLTRCTPSAVLWRLSSGTWARCVAGQKTWAPSGPYDSPSGLLQSGQEIWRGHDRRGSGGRHRRLRSAQRRDAKALGFDAVELHGAHGYLIDQFFWQGVNERDRRLWRPHYRRTLQVRCGDPEGRA